MKKLMLLSLVLLVSLSSFAQDLLSKIPKDADFVGVLKGDKLLKQISEKELENYHITSKLLSEFKEISSFREMGIDLHQNFYYFISTTDSISYNCFLMPLQSADKFEKMAASLDEVVQIGAYKGIESRNAAILWDQSTALFVFSFGQPTSHDYGMVDYGAAVGVDEVEEMEEVEEVEIEEREEVEIEIEEREELETEETENESFAKPPLKIKKPKVTSKELIRAFAIKNLSNKSLQNSMAFNQSYLKKRNKKAVASAWTSSYGELYTRLLGLNDMPSYGYPRGMMGDMLKTVQKMKSSDISGVKSLTANLFLKKNVAEMEVLAEMKDEMADYSKKISKQKFNKDFFRYFDGDKVMGYWGVAVNVENTIDGYPKMVSSMLQKIMPEQKEEAALGAEFISILLDAEEIGELVNGDLMMVVSDVVEKEVKYMSYEYDDDFNATKVEKTRTEPMPEFLMMMSTDKLSFFRKAMRLGAKHGLINLVSNGLYKLETKRSKLPLELYVVLKDDILFLASSEYQARDIANGKKLKMSRKHKRKTKNKNGIFYANNDAIINAIPFDLMSPREKAYLDYFHSNFKDMEISSYKIKNNVVKTKMSVHTSGAGKNALESFFGMIDQFFID